MKDPQNGAFAEILARLETAIAPTDEDLPAVGQAIRDFRERLPDVTNMGQSGDERDLFVLLDGLTAAVREAYPGSMCRAGCSACCDSDTAVFDASPAEWALIERHMAEAWTETDRAAFLARFEAEHGQRLAAYRMLGWIRHFEPVADRYFERAPYRCPFLVGGRCSVYTARPLVCRMYGYFAVRTRWYRPPAIYACRQQADYFDDVRRTEALHLPSADMVVARSKRFFRGRGRLLPIWIAAWRRRQ